MNYNINQISKSLDKLFQAGFTDERSINNMKLEDLLKMNNLTTTDVGVIIEFKKAIKARNIVAFLSGYVKEESR